MQELCQAFLDKVIPRLLRPLESGGRQIQPHLIHGDIWADNASWNIDTNMQVVYDAAALYAYNECKSSFHFEKGFLEAEQTQWRWQLGGRYVILLGDNMKAYFHFFPVSAPEEDQDDRSMLYCLKDVRLHCKRNY